MRDSPFYESLYFSLLFLTLFFFFFLFEFFWSGMDKIVHQGSWMVCILTN